jgi:uncharacterized protein YcbK (DUF882 family)
MRFLGVALLICGLWVRPAVAQPGSAKPAADSPAADSAKPAADSAKPAADSAKPAADSAKPAEDSLKPAASGDRPGAATPSPGRAKKRAPRASAARETGPPRPAAELVALNTRESFTLRPDAHGRFQPRDLHRFNRFLRCHHTGRVHAIAPRLAQLLYETAGHFEWKRLLVVAGYRAPRIARKKGNPKSPHKLGYACDFRVDGVANTELRDYVRSAFDHVGVGYYPNSGFVHLDVRRGKRAPSAFWVDYSGPGERARYSKTPDADVKEERSQGVEPGEIDREDEGGTTPESDPGPGASAPNSAPSPKPTP